MNQSVDLSWAIFTVSLGVGDNNEELFVDCGLHRSGAWCQSRYLAHGRPWVLSPAQ